MDPEVKIQRDEMLLAVVWEIIFFDEISSWLDILNCVSNLQTQADFYLKLNTGRNLLGVFVEIQDYI